MNPIRVNVIQPQAIPVSITVDPVVDVELGIAINVKKHEEDMYDGPYFATPSEEVQVFETAQKVMTDVFTVEPIPTDYGKITRIGSRILVS